jgi:SPP1 family predicted phage head-tail adaptor
MSPALSQNARLALPTPAGRRIHWITLQNPAPLVPDGDGGFTGGGLADCDPAGVRGEIREPKGRDEEYLAAGTVVPIAVRMITIPYHPQVTTKTVLTFNGRTFNVTGIDNLDERNIELRLFCAEVIA